MSWWSRALPGVQAGRSAEPELLDGHALDPADLRRNLREMAMLNRLPGGADNSVRELRRLLNGDGGGSVLDVGTGYGDVPRRLAREGLSVTAVDVRAEVLRIARRKRADTDGVTFMQADARALPFPDRSFDAVHASLLLHHLDPPDAVQALREMSRVARTGVVVNDLRRGRLAFAVTALTVLALTRGRYTRHDGPASARRAYTLAELDTLAAAAGLHPWRRTATRWPRVTTVYR